MLVISGCREAMGVCLFFVGVGVIVVDCLFFFVCGRGPSGFYGDLLYGVGGADSGNYGSSLKGFVGGTSGNYGSSLKGFVGGTSGNLWAAPLK